MRIINKSYNNLKNFSSEFMLAKPYPHIVLDNFLDEAFFSQLDTETFSIEKNRNDHLDTFLEKN
jgi:hypothetical protein